MILVTGGAGFIGSNFIQHWISVSDEEVLNLDKLTYAGNLLNLNNLENRKQYKFIQGDILDSELIQSILQEYEPRAIINFAAESHVDRSIHGPKDFILTNILGTYELLEASKHYWQSLEDERKNKFRFLHISTDEVYGSLSKVDPSFTENNQHKPNSPYSASKASSDHLVRAYFKTYGLPVLTTNCSNNYGPFQFPEKLIPLVINNIFQKKDIPVYGNGLQIRDWLYVVDHCKAIKCVLDKGELGEIYNVGGMNEKKNIEVVSEICMLMDKKNYYSSSSSANELITYVEDRPGHDTRYAIDNSKISNKLKWTPKENFESGIEKTIKWYFDNKDWVHSVMTGEYRAWIAKQYSHDQ
ncbi:dTDP-glucose 4,6-dehydratase [Gammaproteobacteria bacterium]|nr:dTDP-glucose 4,6-dehydratase [Gammaproteobacteria bacterium]